ncbi:MAG TPA: UDP-2,3-diacylglucosamine diphosphatase [Pseudomonadales bacterium]|jgi:UDP-2,3-diacylglucosamine hydrolase|nr:UDP-2,3-diacylglucosamine diphosphatase [Pseudomonadales bacterium]HNI37726.1 UDP-2,3-diacylglucosamine diphosphatase [Pseudomonadales bacterium]
MNALFISDLHLSEERPHTTAAFFAFLAEKTRGVEQLYILGDFFDAWIGDDDDRPLAEAVANALHAVTARGVKIFFQHGNRDFLLGEQYAARCGMQLLPALSVIEDSAQHILLAHGDQFCTQDVAYQQFRALVRNPQWQREFLAKSLAERRAIAAQLRAKSKEANSIKAEDIMDVTPAEVIDALEKHQCTVLIHGHTHRPARHAITLAHGMQAERIVLSDWAEQYGYLQWKEGAAELLWECAPATR